MLSIAGYIGIGTASEQQQPQKGVEPARVDDAESGNIKENAKAEVIDHSNRYVVRLCFGSYLDSTYDAGCGHSSFRFSLLKDVCISLSFQVF